MANIINIGGGAGGGNTEYRELNFADYQALSKAEQENGDLYFITDINGDGSQFQPVIYSETEREIGVWTDGKPLYEKVLHTNTPTVVVNNAWTAIPWTNEPSNIDKLVNVELTGVTPNVWYQVRFSYENNHICCASETSSNFPESSVDTYVVARYTKTTDTAGSGTWTPQGVPAVHYSTTEQVIGTWIDGSTLYEKTFTVSNVTINTSDWQNIEQIADIDKLVSTDGVVTIQFNGQQTGVGPYFNISVNSSGYVRFVCTTWSNETADVIATIRYTKSSS